MSRPKPKVIGEVFVLEEALPYEDSSIEGIFTTRTLAEQHRPEVRRWYPYTDQITGEIVCWRSITQHQRVHDPYFVISPYPVQGAKQ